MILAAVLGVIVASGEFRHTSATLTYLATPDRRRVLGAKAVAGAGAGAALLAAVGVGIGSLIRAAGLRACTAALRG